MPAWLEGKADWLTGSFGGLVLRNLATSCVRTAAVVGTLPSEALIRRRTRLQAQALAALPPPVAEVAYRAHLRRSLVADGVRPDLADRITRRGLARDVLMGRIEGVLGWRVGQEPRDPFVTVLGESDATSSWRDDQIPGPVLRVPGGHRPWCSHPQALLAALQPLWAQSAGS